MGVELGEPDGLGMGFGETTPHLGRLFLVEPQRALVMLLHHPGNLGKIGLPLGPPSQYAVE